MENADVSPPQAEDLPDTPETADVVSEEVQPLIEELAQEDPVIWDPPLQYVKADADRHSVALGDVRPGQQSDDSYLLVRSLGGDDDGCYTLNAQREVLARLKVQFPDTDWTSWDGTVTGKIWAVILHPVRLGDAGHEVSVLRSLAGLTPTGTYDTDLAEVLGTDSVDINEWAQLLA